MPPGKRRVQYSAEDVKLAVRATKEEGLSLRKASEKYNVPKSTIKDYLSDGHGSAMGRPTVLSDEEEVQLLEKIEVLANWGFPLSQRDLCHFVKSYLDKKGVKVTLFKDNLPAKKWVSGFLKRHPDFCLRKANPIKRARAAVSREDIREFFAHYTEAVDGVPPPRISTIATKPISKMTLASASAW
jgi:transposase